MVKVERMDRRSSILWRMTVAPDSDGAVTCALTVAGDRDAQRSRLHPGHIPTPFDEFPSVTGLTGAYVHLNAPTFAVSGRLAGRDYLPATLAADLLIIPWAVQAQSDPTHLTGPIVDGLIALEWEVSARNAASTSGAARVGETPTTRILEFAETHRLRHATFTCRWIPHDGAADAGIPDATGTTCSRLDEDGGTSINARVPFPDHLN